MSHEIQLHDDKYWNKRPWKDYLYLFWQVIWGLPKSLLFNLYYFGIKGLKLPVLCSYKVKFSLLRGNVSIESPLSFGMIKLGFTAPNMYDNSKLSMMWVNDGNVVFTGTAGIRNGCTIRNYGNLVMGANFHISAPSIIICYKGISFGDDVLIGWGCEFADGDAHKVYYSNDISQNRTNVDAEIECGNHVWFGANVKVYKGVKIGNNTVVAGSSVLTKSIEGDNQIVGGYPAQVIRAGINWRI